MSFRTDSASALALWSHWSAFLADAALGEVREGIICRGGTLQFKVPASSSGTSSLTLEWTKVLPAVSRADTRIRSVVM